MLRPVFRFAFRHIPKINRRHCNWGQYPLAAKITKNTKNMQKEEKSELCFCVGFGKCERKDPHILGPVLKTLQNYYKWKK